jgi:aspartyl-tRNA synthetase
VKLNFSYRTNYIKRRFDTTFTIEDETDGGEDIRMKYRYLRHQKNPVKNTVFRQGS